MEFLFDLPHASAVLPVLEHVINLSEPPAAMGDTIKDPPPPKFSFEIDLTEAPSVVGDTIKDPPPPPK